MRRGPFFCVLIVLWGLVAACERSPARPPERADATAAEIVDQGVLRVAIPREPSTWNRLLVTDIVTRIVADQLHAPLIRLNQQTQTMEAALAESWEFSEDGTELVFRLREGLRFSDGAPFTAADVVFTFRALQDPKAASPLKDTAEIDGKPLVAEALGDTAVRFRLPRRTATVERVFDSIRILPQHVLAQSLEAGSFALDSGLSAPVGNIVGLGPFRLREHLAGQRVVLEKNPHYFGASEQLPRLSGLVFEVVPDDSAQLLRLRSGEVDLIERLGPDAFRELKAGGAGGLVVKDLGPSLVSERLWFNLNPASPIAEHKKAWFSDVRFRRAVSLAIDREGLARVVFEGLASPAVGPVSPANHFWRDASLTATVQDLEASRALLAEAGFGWDDDGKLHDADGNPVRFTVITNSGDNQRRRAGAFVQEDLARLGMDVVLAPIDGGTLFASVTDTFDYDACLLGFAASDPDPSAEMGMWLSHAPLHLWHPAQSEPATRWEARIDALMESQMGSVDAEHRKACYHEVQRIVLEHLPLLDLVVPHALVGYSARVQGVRATPFSDSLWNSDELFLE